MRSRSARAEISEPALSAQTRSRLAQAKHPALVVQDPKGLCKPICHTFEPRHGRSTFPILMLGHPEDVPGGPLVSNEATVYERKQRAKREAAAAADPQLALEQRRKEERRQAEKREERAARHKVRRGKRCAPTETELASIRTKSPLIRRTR